MSRAKSSLLIDEQPLQVIPTLAVKLGLNRAMFIQQLHYWLQKPGAHERDEQRWIYNTFQEWHEQFPFWSAEAIRKIAAQLQKRGLIKTTARYNARKGDRTLWYTIDYEKLNALLDPSEETPEEPPENSPQPPDQPDKSTRQPDKSTQLYQRLTTESYDLQSSGEPEKEEAESQPEQQGDMLTEVKPIPLNKYYTLEFYDRVWAHHSVKLRQHQFTHHLSQFQRMLDQYEPQDAEIERVLAHMVRKFPSSSKIDALGAIQDVRLKRDTGEAWSGPAPWEAAQEERREKSFYEKKYGTGKPKTDERKREEAEFEAIMEEQRRILEAS